MKYKPLMSIITVCYNSENTIEDTILSVLNQTYQKIEYIIIDGKSNDNTISIIKKYQPLFKEKGIIYTWISEKDKGIYNAMNKGIKMSNGEWIGIINSDDWYELDAIKNIVLKINKHSKVELIHGNMNVYRNKDIVFISKPDVHFNKIKKGMYINHPTVFVKKDVYNKYGLLSEKFKIVSDWHFILKVYKFINIKYLENIIISNFRDGGISSQFTIEQAKEKHKARKLLKIYKIIDIYYIYDLIKLSLIKEKTFENIKYIKQKFSYLLN